MKEYMFEMSVKLKLTAPLLGTNSNNPNIASEFQLAKRPELLDVSEQLSDLADTLADVSPDIPMTVFLKAADENGEMHEYLSSHMILGFFKEACGALARNKDTKSSKLKAYKKVIDTNIFIKERKLFIQGDYTVGTNERPLRTSGPKGERVALANSEEIVWEDGEEVWLECTIQCLQPKLMETVAEWLDYGQYHGLGQWRNARYGTFEWELLDGAYTDVTLNSSNQNRLAAMLKEHDK